MIAAGREFYEVTQVCTSLTLDLAPQYIPMWLVKYALLSNEFAFETSFYHIKC